MARRIELRWNWDVAHVLPGTQVYLDGPRAVPYLMSIVEVSVCAQSVIPGFDVILRMDYGLGGDPFGTVLGPVTTITLPSGTTWFRNHLPPGSLTGGIAAIPAGSMIMLSVDPTTNSAAKAFNVSVAIVLEAADDIVCYDWVLDQLGGNYSLPMPNADFPRDALRGVPFDVDVLGVTESYIWLERQGALGHPPIVFRYGTAPGAVPASILWADTVEDNGAGGPLPERTMWYRWTTGGLGAASLYSGSMLSFVDLSNDPTYSAMSSCHFAVWGKRI